MVIRVTSARRRGAVLPLVVLCMIALIGLLALAIDIGLVAVARTQCQNAADAAAMAGARTINGNEIGNYNFDAVPGNTITAAVANKVLSKNIQGDPKKPTAINAYTYQSGEVTVEVGAYTYLYDDASPGKEGFQVQFPRIDSAEPYGAVRATITTQGSYGFGRIFGLATFNTTATATAVHRPRDVIIVMDLSGSMRFQSLPGTPMNASNPTLANPSSQSSPRVNSLNPETVFPKFGHYSDISAAALQGTSSYSTGDEVLDPCNISASSNSGAPILEDFYKNAYGVPPTSADKAFARAADAQEKTPGGDNFLKETQNTGANYAKTISTIVVTSTGDVDFERSGYQKYTGTAFQGYTEGPGYWGKTFFVWPPDPTWKTSANALLDPNNAANHADNGSRDWRKRFFFKLNTANNSLGWLDHNNILYEPSGQTATTSNPNPTPTLKWPEATTTVTEKGASVTYKWRPNYAAILHWLRNQTPKHFPTQLRAGRIKYYDAMPDPSDTTLNNRWWTTYNLSDKNEMFWREYIDFVLGIKFQSDLTYSRKQNSVPISALIGNGDFFTWGTRQISQKPDVNAYATGNINNPAGYTAGHSKSSNILVKNFASGKPVVGEFLRFGTSPILYKIATVNAVAGVTVSIRVDADLVEDVANNAAISAYSNCPVCMSYTDNPLRPRHQWWFGPMTLIDYLGNYNTNKFWWPGNCHEAQAWAAKVGIQTAIDDIKKNHPSDFIALAYFSSPKYSAAGSGQHNRAVVPLGRNYQQLKDSLWFPFITVTGKKTEINAYDTADMDQVPRSKGGTSPGMGLLITYNLLSSSTTNLRFYSQPQPDYRGVAGGLGRRA